MVSKVQYWIFALLLICFACKEESDSVSGRFIQVDFTEDSTIIRSLAWNEKQIKSNGQISEVDTILLPNDWLIDPKDVFDGGPGKDGIPALSSPNLVDAVETSYLDDNDLVVGFANCGSAVAYPHDILDWHEIINDKIGELPFAIVYCPLTGSATNWDRRINGQETTYGVSGLLWNTNIIPYDRLTDSNWSQLIQRSVNGEMVNQHAFQYPVLETSWNTWKKLYPATKVVSTSTGHSRSYGRYPYGDYRTSNRTIFPIDKTDNRLPLKTRVLGVIEGNKAKTYQFSDFPDSLGVIHDEFQGRSLVLVGSKKLMFMTGFSRALNGSVLTFEALDEERFPSIMRDQDNNEWDVFGVCLNGERKGQVLDPVRSYLAYWFSFPAVFDEVTLYTRGS